MSYFDAHIQGVLIMTDAAVCVPSPAILNVFQVKQFLLLTDELAAPYP